MTEKGGYQTWETVFTNAKAGMADVDKDHVKRVVYEASQGSAHFANEQRKQAAVDAKTANLQKHAQQLTAAQLESLTAACDAEIAQLDASRDLTRLWLHMDMDAFFASVEERDAPHLKDVPMAVGGMGMITTANYHARKYGVRSAMPGFIARKLCPSLVFVPPNFTKYSKASAAVRHVITQFDPLAEMMSLDEAYLDITEYTAQHEMDGAAVGQRIREAVHRETGLTCSVGVAPNRMLAKVCSDLNKPNGQYILPNQREAVVHFVSTLPIRKIPGVGKVTEQMLRALGVSVCADLLRHRGLLRALFSKLSMDFFLSAALGLGSTSHAPAVREGEAGRKGISCERTFAPLSNKRDLEAKCKELVEHLAADMAAHGNLKGKTLTLKLKTTAFEVRTRASTLHTYIGDASTMYEAAHRLLVKEMPCELRLMGVRMSGFLETAAPIGQHTLDAFVRAKAEQPITREPASSTQGPTSSAQGPTSKDAPEETRGNNAQHATSTQDVQSNNIPHNNPTNEEDELPTLGDWVEGTLGTPVELSLGDWHQPGPCTQQGASKEAPSKVWECTTCTYAHNPSTTAFCEVCGRLRGIMPSKHQPEEPDEEAVLQCTKCGKTVAQDDLIVHMDWHLALELQRQDGSSMQVVATKSKRGEQRKIDAFLSSKQKQQRLS